MRARNVILGLALGFVLAAAAGEGLELARRVTVQDASAKRGVIKL